MRLGFSILSFIAAMTLLLWWAVNAPAEVLSSPITKVAHYLAVDPEGQAVGVVEWNTDGGFVILDVNCRVVAKSDNKTPSYFQSMKNLGNWKAVGWGKRIAEQICQKAKK